METAILRNNEGSPASLTYASDWQNGERPPEDADLVCPDTALPVVFRAGHSRQGNEIIVRPCFAYGAGYAPARDHFFDRSFSDSFRQAAIDEKNIILSLNTDLSYRPLNFRNIHDSSASSLEDWMSQHKGNYISVGIHSAADAIRKIKAIRQHNPAYPLNDKVFALYRGGILPYRDFYIGNRQNALCRTYNALHSGNGGVTVGNTNIVGLPRLLKFQITQTTLNENGTQGLKGNGFYDQDSKAPFFSRLIFSNDDERKNTPEYRSLFNTAAQHQRTGIFVLASPVVSRNENGKWHMMRWVINNIDAQTTPPLGNPPKPQANL